jgi:hypothetical protein
MVPGEQGAIRSRRAGASNGLHSCLSALAEADLAILRGQRPPCRRLTHLVMPGGLDETREILRFLSQEVSPNTFVNVMPQYHPEGLAMQHEAIARPLRASEFRDAVAAAQAVGLRLARD